MLGVGPDGHVASLFPGFPQLDVDDRIAVAVTGSPKPPPERISLTFAALNRAKSVWFLVSGDEKAAAVARALAEGTDLHDIPAAGVTGSEETIWFLDRPAASQPLSSPSSALTRDFGVARTRGRPADFLLAPSARGSRHDFLSPQAGTTSGRPRSRPATPRACSAWARLPSWR